MTRLASLWSYRGFILSSVKREFQHKYQSTLLGPSWAVLNPLAMILVYTLIFSQVMRAKLPGVDTTFAYSIYLCAGILTWGLFNEIVTRGQNSFVENANLLKKINFPRFCLPTIVVLNAVVNFSIIFTLFTAFLILSGHFPGWPFLALVPLLAILIFFAIGLGVTLGVLNVFFRDVGQFFAIFLQFWFWLTPIVYPVNVLPALIGKIVMLNPLAPLMAGFQDILVLGQWPQWITLIYPTILALLLCVQGMRLFRRHASDLVDEL
ncbi:ABC transporter permease [Polynucleobacter rarus]|uniref:ABC transporter permease n=1 Tax=Polynucleobacter rarus TaxID=556055 RepID=UPI000D3E2FBF|nr:ABC transporter permease [Polynucleobacter rarus]